MTNIRTYGIAPYSIATIHGGPGAIGSLGNMSEQLSAFCGEGVIEPLQSRYTIQELINELHEQLQYNTLLPITIIGHSWGAWLAILYAKQYPQEIKNLILVGTPPLDDKYVSLIMERRLMNLSKSEATHFQELLQSSLPSLEEIENLVYKSDNYSPILQCLTNKYSLPLDDKMNQLIWHEATIMRSKGVLKHLISQLSCSIHIIHGENDPHPVEGIIVPIENCNVNYRKYILPNCGHSPFNEKEWKDRFYGIIASITAVIKPYYGRIPACGVFCGGCPTYTRDKRPCPGAELNKSRCEKCSTFHLCCVEKEITHCFQCSAFPCNKFKSFSKRWRKYGQDFAENQKLLKQVGEIEFLKIYNEY